MDATIRPTLDFEVLSACGPVRQENQDAGIAWQDSDGNLALIVSDGMGGHAAGREAAEIVIRSCVSAFRQRSAEDSWEESLALGLNEAHTAVVAAQEVMAAQQESASHRMGATAAIALLEAAQMPPRLHVAHVGDSRVYLLRGRSLYRLTTDHSLVAQMVRDGLIREEDAADHPDSNVIQRAVGQHSAFEPEIQLEAQLEGGDLVLVCSDGLHGSIPEETICDIAGRGDAATVCRHLLAAALEHGSADNITIGCCRVPLGDQQRRPTRVP